MPSKTKPTDAQIVERLAVKMGWKIVRKNGMVFAKLPLKDTPSWYILSDHDTSFERWNPLADLNAVAKVEARLTDEQREWYAHHLCECVKALDLDNKNEEYFALRHASPRTCCEALWEVLHDR